MIIKLKKKLKDAKKKEGNIIKTKKEKRYNCRDGRCLRSQCGIIKTNEIYYENRCT